MGARRATGGWSASHWTIANARSPDPPVNPLIALHDTLSHRILWPARQRWRALRREERGAFRAYQEGLQFRTVATDWSREARDVWVLARLRTTLRWAYDTTDYYRAQFERIGFDPRTDFGFDDFARLPVLTRADLQVNGPALRSRAVPSDEVSWNATGGSTGRPVEIWMGPEERGWRASGSEGSMRRLGVGIGIRRALLWGHHLDPVARASRKDKVADFLVHRRWYDCLRLSADILASYDRDLRRYQPRCIVAYASALAALADQLEVRGAPPPNYPTRCIVTGAEKLFAEQRAVIERVFRRPVHERYGSRDVGDMAFQYLARGDAHFDVDWPLVMVEPQSDEPESPILVTKLRGDAMPMIRYVNDDVARFPPGACPGHPAYQLEEIIGRILDRVMLPTGRWVHGAHFPHLLKDFPLRDFQVHQSADYSVRVRFVPTAVFGASHRAELEANLAANLPGIRVTVDEVDAILRTRANKWRPVTSEVPE